MVSMEKIAENKKILKVMFTALLVLACFQNLRVVPFMDGAALKVVHIASLAFFPFLCVKKEIRLNKPIAGYVVYIIIISLLDLSGYGLSSLMFNYIFGVYLVVLCTNCGENLSYNDWLDVICCAATILMTAVQIKNVRGYENFVWYFEHPDKGHPWGLRTIISDGLNLESTWLGMFAFFFYRSRWKWFYAGVNMLTAFLYGSRAGMLVGGAAIVWLLLPELVKLKERKYRILTGIAIGAAAVVLYASGLYDAVIGRALSRFFNGFQDAGSMGRIRMWQYAAQAFLKNPWGCGAGNCMKAVSAVSGEYYSEGNIHNVYLQNLIDQGLLGELVYFGMLGRFFWKEKGSILKNPFVAAALVYCGISMIQFRGGETLMFILLGMELTGDAWQEDLLKLKNPFQK